jgi:polyisoprenoid-binding protein YceI
MPGIDTGDGAGSDIAVMVTGPPLVYIPRRMRHRTFLAAFLVVAACKSEIDNKPAAAAKDAPAGAKVQAPVAGGPALDTAASKIDFVGSKVSLDHAGSFSKFTASIGLEGDKLQSLQIQIDPNSVAIEPAKLREHLLAPDFFDTAKFPTAGFSSTKVTEAAAPATHTIEGLLELRGVTKVVSFPATVTIDAKTAKGTAEFTINRKDFGIEYPGKPDDLIKDDVLLKVSLAFNR